MSNAMAIDDNRNGYDRVATLATMNPDLDNCDMLVGIVLPNLPPQHTSLNSMKNDYTIAESEMIDLTGYDLEYNHHDEEPPVGKTIGWRVNETPNGKYQAEAVCKLNREPDYPDFTDHLTRISSMQRHNLMTGLHRDFSLGHVATKFNAHCDVSGRVNASKSKEPHISYVKEHREISTCIKGKKDGSHIEHYFPCARSLRRSSPYEVRDFARVYNYEQAPTDLEINARKWDAYLAHLLKQVKQRRMRVLREKQFLPTLVKRGFVVTASKDAPNQQTNNQQVEEEEAVCADNSYLSTLELEAKNNLPKQREIVTNSATANVSMSGTNNNSNNGQNDQSQQQQQGQSSNHTSSNVNAAGFFTGANTGTPGVPSTGGAATKVASTTPVSLPSASDKTPIDPYEATSKAVAVVEAERAKNADLMARLAKFEKAEKEKEAAEEAKAKEEKAKNEKLETERVNEKRARIKATLNQTFEEIQAASGGAVTNEDLKGVLEGLLEKTTNANSTVELDRVERDFGPVVGLAMKASKGARQQAQQQKDRELAADMERLNKILGAPPQPSFSVSGGFSDYQQPSQQATYVLPGNAIPVESTAVLNSANRDNNTSSALNIFNAPRGTSAPSRPGASAVVSTMTGSGTAVQSQPTKTVAVDFDNPATLGGLVDEHLEQYKAVPSQQWFRYGGETTGQRIVNSANGGTEIRNVRVPRRQKPWEGDLSAKQVAPVWFQGLVDGINEALKPGNRIQREQIATCVPPDVEASKYLVRFVPTKEDVGVTLFR